MTKILEQFKQDVEARYTEKLAANWKPYIKRFGKRPSYTMLNRHNEIARQVDPLAQYVSMQGNADPAAIIKNKYRWIQEENKARQAVNSVRKVDTINDNEGNYTTIVKPKEEAWHYRDPDSISDAAQAGLFLDMHDPQQRRAGLDMVLMSAPPDVEREIRNSLRKGDFTDKNTIMDYYSQFSTASGDIQPALYPKPKLSNEPEVSLEDIVKQVSDKPDHDVYSRITSIKSKDQAKNDAVLAQSLFNPKGYTFFSPPNIIDKAVKSGLPYPDSDYLYGKAPSQIGVIGRTRAKNYTNAEQWFKDFMTTTDDNGEFSPALKRRLYYPHSFNPKNMDKENREKLEEFGTKFFTRPEAIVSNNTLQKALQNGDAAFYAYNPETKKYRKYNDVDFSNKILAESDIRNVPVPKAEREPPEYYGSGFKDVLNTIIKNHPFNKRQSLNPMSSNSEAMGPDIQWNYARPGSVPPDESYSQPTKRTKRNRRKPKKMTANTSDRSISEVDENNAEQSKGLFGGLLNKVRNLFGL